MKYTTSRPDYPNMEQQLLILVSAIFVASVLQSATGIGFGIIAGPVLLIVLNAGSAIQISVILNLLIALILAPSLWRKMDRRLLKSLLTGIAAGTPLGLLIYLYMDIVLLKSFAGAVVLLTLVLLLRGEKAPSSSRNTAASKFEQVSVGVIAGVMGGSLAMPGPVPAAWMSARGIDKDTIRATILIMFVAAYLAALLLQILLVTISSDTLQLTAMLAPSTIAGIFLGTFLSSRISEQVFRKLLMTILGLTTIILFATIY